VDWVGIETSNFSSPVWLKLLGDQVCFLFASSGTH
jgi:hypothetical protein